MGERRVSGWFVLSAVFVVLVFGLFFTFTERKSWPEHRIELGPMDMRLAPPVSTLWCEAVALHSDHSFVAYQVNHATRISSRRLNLQKVDMQLKLGSGWSTNSMKLKYFLLPSSIIQIVACSVSPGVKLLVFKGDLDVHNCLQSLMMGPETSRSSDGYDSDEDSSEEYTELDYHSVDSAGEALAFKKYCSNLLTYNSVDVSYLVDSYSMECNPSTTMSPIKVNVTSADSYIVAVWNTNKQSSNRVKLDVMLDRTRYTVHRSGQPFDLCSLSTSCTIGLGFATGDRVLVSIPEEPNSGRSSYIVRTRCKPRLAVFAILSVFLPLFMFLAVAFVLKTDGNIFKKICCHKRDSNRRQSSNRGRTAAPLLDDQNVPTCDVRIRTEVLATSEQNDEMPPPYNSLYYPPPPYATVKKDERKNSQNN